MLVCSQWLSICLLYALSYKVKIEIKNTSPTTIDILLFGGEEYTEPTVAEGPFVMNSQAEIANAYRDFYTGKYGEIKINRQR